MSRHNDRHRLEEVAGRRVETVEWGLRTQTDPGAHSKEHVKPQSSPEAAAAARDRPFSGYAGDEQVVTRTIVTYTTEWTEVPGYEGSRWFHCWHPDHPDVHAAAGGHAVPLAFREADMVRGDDGERRYTCPVCEAVWQLRDAAPAPQGSLF